MLIETERFNVTTNFKAESDENFKISDENKLKLAMGLSTSLYSDKFFSIVRELSNNAYDSHVAAGTPDKPFKIVAPTSWEPELVVKDYGTGINPNDIINTYCSFGASTKDKTNDLIGGYGLGTKSPFAYTSSFIIQSRWNGEIHSYEIYKGENGWPKCKHLSSVKTDEPNGITVRVPVLSNDFMSFKNAVEKYVSLFNGTIEGWEEHLYKIKYDDKIKDKIIIDFIPPQQLKNTVLFIRNGKFHYPINKEKVLSILDAEDKQFFLFILMTGFKNILLNTSIGEVSFTLSREDVEYTKKTTDTIISYLKYFFEGLKSSSVKYKQKEDETLKEYTKRIIRVKESLGLTQQEIYHKVRIAYYDENDKRPLFLDRTCVFFSQVIENVYLFYTDSSMCSVGWFSLPLNSNILKINIVLYNEETLKLIIKSSKIYPKTKDFYISDYNIKTKIIDTMCMDTYGISTLFLHESKKSIMDEFLINNVYGLTVKIDYYSVSECIKKYKEKLKNLRIVKDKEPKDKQYTEYLELKNGCYDNCSKENLPEDFSKNVVYYKPEIPQVTKVCWEQLLKRYFNKQSVKPKYLIVLGSKTEPVGEPINKNFTTWLIKYTLFFHMLRKRVRQCGGLNFESIINPIRRVVPYRDLSLNIDNKLQDFYIKEYNLFYDSPFTNSSLKSGMTLLINSIDPNVQNKFEDILKQHFLKRFQITYEKLKRSPETVLKKLVKGDIHVSSINSLYKNIDNFIEILKKEK